MSKQNQICVCQFVSGISSVINIFFNVPYRFRKINGPNEPFYESVAFLKFQRDQPSGFYSILVNKGFPYDCFLFFVIPLGSVRMLKQYWIEEP